MKTVIRNHARQQLLGVYKQLSIWIRQPDTCMRIRPKDSMRSQNRTPSKAED